MQFRISKWASPFAGTALIFFLLGCGTGFPSTAPVAGVVRYQGKPVEGATVTFSRETRDANKGEIAIGKTGADGSYQLSTHFGSQATSKGVVPGEYEVTISKFIPPGGMSHEKYQAMVAAADQYGARGESVPAKLQPPNLVEMFPAAVASPGKTTLKATVPAGGNSSLNFDIP